MKTKLEKINARIITVFIMQHFNPRINIVVPNVFWGLDFEHELDVLVCTPRGYTTEIEIKVSRADLINDGMKQHKHYDNRLNYHYFAVPENLADTATAVLPDKWGLLVLKHATTRTTHGYVVEVAKKASKELNQPGFGRHDMDRLNRLGTIRLANVYRENFKLRKKLNNIGKEFFDWV